MRANERERERMMLEIHREGSHANVNILPIYCANVTYTLTCTHRKKKFLSPIKRPPKLIQVYQSSEYDVNVGSTKWQYIDDFRLRHTGIGLFSSYCSSSFSFRSIILNGCSASFDIRPNISLSDFCYTFSTFFSRRGGGMRMIVPFYEWLVFKKFHLAKKTNNMFQRKQSHLKMDWWKFYELEQHNKYSNTRTQNDLLK